MINFTHEGIVIALSYLLPGFLMNVLLAQTFRLDKSSGSDAIYKFLFFSVVNLLVVSSIDWIYFKICGSYLIQSEVLTLGLRNLILPTILSILTAMAFQKVSWRELSKFNQMLGFDTVSRTESAWDYVFDKLASSGSFIIIKLKRGEYIYALYASNSFATIRNKQQNGIYVEQTYFDFEAKPLKENGYGMWINFDEIESIRIDSNQMKRSKNDGQENKSE